MRKLPYLNAVDSGDMAKLYRKLMDKGLQKDEFEKRFIEVCDLFHDLTKKQSNEILEKMTGYGVEKGGLNDEDQIQILEPDIPMRAASEVRPWQWVDSNWDHNDLDNWNKLIHPDIDTESNEEKWDIPVPQKGLIDLLYNSKRIIDGIPNPKKWDDYGNRTGLVLGSVQSGKTASMLGVSAIAMDEIVGYKIIIVLAGHTENLRQQTLKRFEVFKKIMKRNIQFAVQKDTDLENVSKDNKASKRVAMIESNRQLLDDGDGFPVIWVVKKNTHVLKGLISIMEGLHENGKKYPALILDDESDHSSLNTKRKSTKGSEIHKLIGKLRDSISRNAYIGYTATPQGVLLSDPKQKLFPRDFLWLLDPHDKYFGPAEFFNEYSEFCISSISEEEFPNYGNKKVEEDLEKKESPKLHEWQAQEIEKWLDLERVPKSLNSSIIDFILTGSIRWWRDGIGENPIFPDHSMIFHLDRRNVSQEIMGKVVNNVWENCIDKFYKLIERNFIFSCDFDKLIEKRWERLLNNIEAIRIDPKDRPEIKDLEEFIKLIINEVGDKNDNYIRDGLRILNGKEDNELPYHLPIGNGRPPKALIVIGGDLLSRGLTIEGLTVSYYLRLAKIPSADTELQRCRWFGAKWDYRDLLTLHIQPAHQRMFKDLSDHNEDLMRQAKEGILRGFTPEEIIFILAIKSSYNVTSRNKSGKLRLLEDSYSGNACQFKQPSFKKSNENIALYHEYLEKLGKPEILSSDRGKIWENVSKIKLFEFLDKINYDVDAPNQIKPDDLSRYLRKWIKEESRWDEFPIINIVQRYGRNKSEISEARREMDGADGIKIPRTSFTNLAAGKSNNFSGDWYIDATDYSKKEDDYRKKEEKKRRMNYEKYNKWFIDKPTIGKNRESWDTKSRTRNFGAPILIVFYKLDPKYISLKRSDGENGKWYSDSGVITDDPLLGFIASIPKGGPTGGGIINPLLDLLNARIIGGRVNERERGE